MKKIAHLLTLLTLVTISCKKDQKPSNPKDEVATTLSQYYEIGTSINATKTNTITGKVSDTRSGGAISYAIMPPYNSTYTFPEILRYSYLIDTEAARSANGLYSLLLQSDGNLVLYKRSSPNGPMIWTALWATNAYSSTPPNPWSGTAYTEFQEDGNIVCHNYNGNIYWASNVTAGPKPIWILQDDGNLVGYKNYTVSPDPNPHVVITGSPFAATFTDGGRVSNNFGRVGIAH